MTLPKLIPPKLFKFPPIILAKTFGRGRAALICHLHRLLSRNKKEWISQTYEELGEGSCVTGGQAGRIVKELLSIGVLKSHKLYENKSNGIHTLTIDYDVLLELINGPTLSFKRSV